MSSGTSNSVCCPFIHWRLGLIHYSIRELGLKFHLLLILNLVLEKMRERWNISHEPFHIYHCKMAMMALRPLTIEPLVIAQKLKLATLSDRSREQRASDTLQIHRMWNWVLEIIVSTSRPHIQMAKLRFNC